MIALGVIGVVAALTIPTLNAIITKKVRTEQIRTVKYKFTKATEKMATLRLIGPYDSTSAFVSVLQKHLKIVKVCDASHLRDCWPYDTITLQDGKEYEIEKLQTGKQFQMDTSDDKDYTSANVGIITGDGTPMILSYNTKCEALDPSIKTLTWSTEDGKPVTNASTSCIAAVFEINGSKRPNKQNEDVVLFNANGLGSGCTIEVDGKCFGSPFSPTPMTKADCEAEKNTLGIKYCYYDNDYWAGAVKQCGGVGNMATMTDLGKIASMIYNGNPTVGAYSDVDNLTYTAGTASSLGLPEPSFSLWSGEEYGSNGNLAYYRHFNSSGTSYSYYYYGGITSRGSGLLGLCLSG